KGVLLSQRSCWLNAVTLGWHTGVSDRDVYLHTLPTFHCNGWGMPYALTAMGVRQVIIRKIDGAEMLRRMETERVTLLNGAPAVELRARSNHVFDGYYEQPDETARAIVDGWFYTGDGGHLDGAYAVVMDRKKDVIITVGENVSSIELEDCLYQHAEVA